MMPEVTTQCNDQKIKAWLTQKGKLCHILVHLSADVQHFDMLSLLMCEGKFITMFLPHPSKFMKLIPALKG